MQLFHTRGKQIIERRKKKSEIYEQDKEIREYAKMTKHCETWKPNNSPLPMRKSRAKPCKKISFFPPAPAVEMPIDKEHSNYFWGGHKELGLH